MIHCILRPVLTMDDVVALHDDAILYYAKVVQYLICIVRKIVTPWTAVINLVHVHRCHW